MVVKAAASPILNLIRQAAEDPRLRELSDQELLQRFSVQKDQAAFHALLRRHGPMVLDVCRGALSNEADAEDAFQATFLVLARKAGSIRKSASLGSWLHGVAYRTGLKSRAQSATRDKHEARVTARQAMEPGDPSWRDVRQVLHEELSGLPERYRAPLVLCYLEGATQEAAAGQLNLAKSTLRERLERGRALLRNRLMRRGLGPAALLVAAAWPVASVSACVSPSVVSSTIQAASLFAAGQAAAAGVVSAKVAALTEGVLKAMLVTKLKNATAILVAIALIAAGVIGVAMQGPKAVAGSQIDAQKEDKVSAAVQDKKPAATDPAQQKTDESTPDVRILQGHRGAVYFAFFSPNGATLVTAAKGFNFKNLAAPRKDEVILWDVTAQRAKHKITFEPPVEVWCMSLSPDGKTLALGMHAGIELRDAETGQTKHKLKGPWALSTGPFSLAFSPNSKTLAAGGSARDNTVRLVDVQTGELTGTLKGHEDAVAGLSFSPDGKTLASTGGQYDTTIRYWEVATGKLRLTVNKAKEESKDGTEAIDGDWQTWPVAFSPDGKILARGRGAEVKFWDARTGEVKDRVIEDPHPGDRIISRLAFSPDGKLVAAGRNSGEIDVLATRPADGKHDWRIGDLQQTLKEHSHPVMALAFSSSGEFLASGDQDGKVRVWKTTKK
jgi:RNA polymerase sigma factor (sigma-70 family)